MLKRYFNEFNFDREKYLKLLTIFFENLPEDTAADYFDNLIGLQYISQDHE